MISICLALGEMGRNSPLVLPPGAEKDAEGEMSKLSIVNTLLKMLKSSKESNKVAIITQIH